jgi:hypothetical protein
MSLKYAAPYLCEAVVFEQRTVTAGWRKDLVELLGLDLVDALLLDLLVEEERSHLRQFLHPRLRVAGCGF